MASQNIISQFEDDFLRWSRAIRFPWKPTAFGHFPAISRVGRRTSPFHGPVSIFRGGELLVSWSVGINETSVKPWVFVFSIAFAQFIFSLRYFSESLTCTRMPNMRALGMAIVYKHMLANVPLTPPPPGWWLMKCHRTSPRLSFLKPNRE